MALVKRILNNRGISPIIAVILLLVITMALTSTTYLFMLRTRSNIQAGVENISTTELQKLQVNLRIEGFNTSCSGSSIWVRIQFRNAGTETARNVQLSVDGFAAGGASNSSVGAGVSSSYLLSSQVCSQWKAKTRTIKISSDETSAEKDILFSCTTSGENCT